MLSDKQKLGVGLLGFGLFFIVMGVLLFLDAGLLAVGNLLFVSGMTTLYGGRNTLAYFMRRDKATSSASFWGGIILVLCKYPFSGFLLEAVGIFFLFRAFYPAIMKFLGQLPVIGRTASRWL